MRDSRACCGRPSAGRSNSRPATTALSDGAPAAERSSAAQQILSSELARSTDAAELQLTRPFGGSIADKPESIHDTSCRASGAGTAVTPRGSPAGRQRAGNRSAVSVSAPAAIRGAMDRTRGGADARPWRAAPADRRGRRYGTFRMRTSGISLSCSPARCLGADAGWGQRRPTDNRCGRCGHRSNRTFGAPARTPSDWPALPNRPRQAR